MDWYKRLARGMKVASGMPGDIGSTEPGTGLGPLDLAEPGTGLGPLDLAEPGTGLGPLDLAEPGVEPAEGTIPELADGPTIGEPGAGPRPARPDKIKPGPRKSLFRKNVWRIQP
jgi:hypothetical protein